MRIVLLDGYIDEPSRLGVPPYISPELRSIAGAIKLVGFEYEYLSIDDWRRGIWPKGDLLIVLHGALVPGRYLLTYPASKKELVEIAKNFRGKKILAGPTARFHYFKEIEKFYDFVAVGDSPAYIYDLLMYGQAEGRRMSIKEWNSFLLEGADIVLRREDFPDGVVVEVETSIGCPRYFVGGCSFCTEPLYGEVRFRNEEDIIREVKKLISLGAKFFRVGGQSCIVSYKGFGIGKKEIVEPNVGAIKNLFEGLRGTRGIEVLHIDNANPAVIANYEEKSRKILEIVAENCTSGNVLALGMESADPEVIKKNNLNSTPEEVMKSVEIINEIGSDIGENGLPKMLPGINFLGGLDGESKRTYQLNMKFLMEVEEKNLLLRRINVRKVAPTRRKFRIKYEEEFKKFRRFVREYEKRMLKRILPVGSVLRNVRTEIWKGTATYARQMGSYPIIVVIPDKVPLKKFIDVKIYAHAERSVRAIPYPLNINEASTTLLKKIPGMDKYLLDVLNRRPFSRSEELVFLPEEVRNWLTT